MTLLIDELFNGVVFEQEFRINRSISIAHIRPWILKWGNLLSGDFTCEVWQNGNLLKSESINYQDINEQIPGTFAHGQLRFDLNPLQLNHDTTQEYTYYTLKLYMDNYTNNENAYIAVNRRYEQKFYDIYGDQENGEALNDMIEPLGFEVFEYR